MKRQVGLLSLVLLALFIGGLMTGHMVKAARNIKVLRFNAAQFFIMTPATQGTWETVGSVTVQSKLDGGAVYVQGSGMSVMPAGSQLTLSIADTPAARGPWVFGYSGDPAVDSYEDFNAEMTFYPPAGSHNYYLNATFFTGTGGADVELGNLTAWAVQVPLVEWDWMTPPTAPESSGPTNSGD